MECAKEQYNSVETNWIKWNKCFQYKKTSWKGRWKIGHMLRTINCHGCLKQGHSAKDGQHCLTCDTCMRRHPTCLHNDNYLIIKHKITHQRQQLPCHLMLSGKDNLPALDAMIVPVWVSSTANPYKEKLP